MSTTSNFSTLEAALHAQRKFKAVFQASTQLRNEYKLLYRAGHRDIAGSSPESSNAAQLLTVVVDRHSAGSLY
jgi:hypothetical protein